MPALAADSAAAFGYLANKKRNKGRIEKFGGIDALILLLRNGTAEGKTAAARSFMFHIYHSIQFMCHSACVVDDPSTSQDGCFMHPS